MREVVLDTETTGLSPADGHRILEIGAVEIVHRTLTGRVFHTLVNPERDVPEDAARVHGHATAVVKHEPVFAEVVDAFLAFLGDAKLVIHNAEFDMRFVNAELARLGRSAIRMDRVTDTLTLARRRHPGQPNSLDALCDRYRIDRLRRIRHGALLDAEILAEIYCELTDGRQRSLDFVDGQKAAGPHAAVPSQRMVAREQRDPLIEADEGRAHAEYVRSLGDGAIWLLYLSHPA